MTQYPSRLGAPQSTLLACLRLLDQAIDVRAAEIGELAFHALFALWVHRWPIGVSPLN